MDPQLLFIANKSWFTLMIMSMHKTYEYRLKKILSFKLVYITKNTRGAESVWLINAPIFFQKTVSSDWYLNKLTTWSDTIQAYLPKSLGWKNWCNFFRFWGKTSESITELVYELQGMSDSRSGEGGCLPVILVKYDKSVSLFHSNKIMKLWISRDCYESQHHT